MGKQRKEVEKKEPDFFSRLKHEVYVIYENGLKYFKHSQEKTIEKTKTKFVDVNYFMQKQELTPAEIAEVRRGIAALKNTAKKEELYLALQMKSPYHSQRDNISVGKKGEKYAGRPVRDVMCNETSLAMGLEYLGVTIPNATLQTPDYLESIRQNKGLGDRTYSDVWIKLANEFSVSGFKLNVPKWKVSYSYMMNNILPLLKEGKAVLMSAFNPGGHIVRLEAITKEGLIVDDPYGRVNILVRKKWKRKSESPGYEEGHNAKGKPDNKGDNNLWIWEEVEQIPIKYFVILSK